MAKQIGSKPTRVLLAERVMAGEERTVAQWAEELHPHLDRHMGLVSVSRDMTRSRQRGIMLFPVPPAEGGPGIVKYVNDNETEFVFAYNRHATNNVEPLLRNNVHYAEVLVRTHPQTRELITQRVAALVAQAKNGQQVLLSISYEPASNALTAGKN